MNWITRCPECATVYQLAPEQIEAAKGWVRCGQCQHAFDSKGLILAWQPAASPAADVAVSGKPDIEGPLRHEDRSIADVPSDASVDLHSFEQALSSFQPEIEKAIHELASSPVKASPSDDFEETSEDARLLKIRRRWPSVLLVLFLTLSLLAQWIWIERFALVARFPALQTHVQVVCRVLSCESLHLRDLQGLVIDTSTFLQRDNGFELQWVVRNTTDQSVLMTALEITLQDAQGNPLLRRVFLPEQLHAPTVMVPAQVWQGTLLIKVASDKAVTGYRVLSFYP
jgi:predicted Zn finger-like uncharacterized protein